MDVAPHPHIGLQTVTWLLEGEVLHDDSLMSQAILRPGGVNVMTSGDGIAHAEQTPPTNIGHLNGIQLWVALTDQHRRMPPSFVHIPEVPSVVSRGGVVQVFTGTIDSACSRAPHYSELLGADVQIYKGESITIPINAHYEHALLVLAGDCAVEGHELAPKTLHYLGTSRTELSFSSRDGGRALLIGGPPFPETILMWWNFVARTPEEIGKARSDWEQRRRFGDVPAYKGPRLSAPDLVRFAHPNPVS
jgi:redox-sensitive bicupin YhaK (pirin superfamily)